MFTIEERQVLFHVTPAHDPLTGKPVALDFDQLVLDPYTGRELGHYKMDDWSNWRPNIMNIVYGVHTTLATRSGDGWQFMGYVVWCGQLTLWLLFGTLPRGGVLSGRGGSRHGE